MSAFTTPFRELMLQQPCTYCGAAPGVSCQSKSGLWCPMHSARFYAAQEVRRKEEADDPAT